MGYVSRQKYYLKCYVPSDDIIVSSVAVTLNAVTDWVKVKEIQLAAPVVSNSTFRFVFTLAHTDGGAGIVYGQIRRNGVIVGSLFQRDNGEPPLVCTEDIATSTWVVGDTIEFWSKATAFSRVSLYNAYIKGLGSEFENTLGM